MRGIDLSYIEQYQEVPPCPLDSKIMFTSAYRPNVMAAALRKEGWQDLRPVITADEAEAIRIMNEKVALEESVAQFENDAKNYASPDQPPKLFKHDAVHGVDAIRDFVNYHLEPKAYTHMPQEVFPKHVDVRLKLGDNALHESYVDSAFLQNPLREAFKNRSITDELGALKQPFRKAWSVLAKYEDDIVGIPDIYHQWDIKYSPIEVEDLESFRQELTENFLGGKPLRIATKATRTQLPYIICNMHPLIQRLIPPKSFFRRHCNAWRRMGLTNARHRHFSTICRASFAMKTIMKKSASPSS